MQQNFNYGEATSQAYNYLQQNFSYQPATLRHYKNSWNPVKSYMSKNGFEFISPDVCKSFLLDLYKGREQRLELTNNEKVIRRSVLVLSEFLETGAVQLKRKSRSLDGAIGMHMKDFIAYKQSFCLKTLTLNKVEIDMSHFNSWLSANGISNIENVKQPQVISFIKSLDAGKPALVQDTLKHLRGFFSFLYDQRIITTKMADFIPKSNYKHQAKLPSYYTEEEIEKLLKSVDRGNIMGKRDDAILTLAAYLGLRASDIAYLQFKNLQWEKNSITLKQYKTGKDIQLPLLPVVGNALIDYIQYGRPISSEPYIFLLLLSPFRPVGPQTVTAMISNKFVNAGLGSANRRHGGHALRHSLVKELLKGKQSISVISEVLGHKSITSTRHYIRIDTENLRRCALDVPPVDPLFYTQEGGILS